jgi:hypothetical protein
MRKANYDIFGRLVKSRAVIIAAFILFAIRCSTISHFDHYAYIQTTSVKVETLNVMELAVTDYTLNAPAVRDVESQIRKIYEYEKNRPKNDITVNLWNKLRDPERNLYGGFIARWKSEGTLNKTFIDNAQDLISDAFDQILQLESKKIKPSDIK